MINLIFLLILICTSFFLSSRMILSGDFFYLADNARDMILARDIVLNRDITLIGTHSGIGGFFHGPIWLYLLVPFFVLGGGNPMFFTSFYILIPLITVLAGYLVGKKLYGERIGLITAFLLSITPTLWSPVPLTISINLVPLIFLGMFYFLVSFLRGDNKSFVFASFLAGLSLHFETALPLILIPALVVVFIVNRNPIKNIKWVLLSIASYALSVSNFILFDLRHNFLMTRSFLGFLTGSEKAENYLGFSERLREHSQSLLEIYKSVLPEYNLSIFLLVIICVALFLYLYRKTKEHKEVVSLMVFPCLIFLFYLLYSYPVYREYVFGLSVPVILGFSVVLHKLGQNEKTRFLSFVLISLLFVQALLVLSRIYSDDKKNETAGSYQNQSEAVQWIFENSEGKEFGYFVYTPETYTYGVDYLMWWEGKNRGIKLESQKRETTYLVMYPPLQNDDSAHDFWKKNVINTNSSVVERKKFRGNIIVEKLKIEPGEKEASPNYYQNLIFR